MKIIDLIESSQRDITCNDCKKDSRKHFVELPDGNGFVCWSCMIERLAAENLRLEAAALERVKELSELLYAAEKHANFSDKQCLLLKEVNDKMSTRIIDLEKALAAYKGVDHA